MGCPRCVGGGCRCVEGMVDSGGTRGNALSL
nr:MAG TPA: hypothetical protein [Caudoviricetes sp.]